MNVQYILYAVHVHVYLYLQFPGEDDALDLVHVSPNMHVQYMYCMYCMSYMYIYMHVHVYIHVYTCIIL